MLYTKLNRPKISNDLLIRPHLIEKLEKNRHLPLILLSAPTGYGKSLLISQWLEQHGNDYCWLSLDESMNESSTFITYFAKMLEIASSAEMPRMKNLDKEYYLLTWETIISLIINRINELNEPIRLILDDYHLIRNQEIHQLISAIINENISHFHLVIITRRDPPLQLRELRLYQKMLELRIKDLRFDENETNAFLGIKPTVGFNKDEIKEIVARTEGWILGIRMILMAKSFSEEGGEKAPFDCFTNDLDILIDHIGHNFDPEFFRRVQLCALCDQFNSELIDSIFSFSFSETGSADKFISELSDLNLFLVPTVKEGTWYRFHHLFGDILKRRLQKSEPNIIKPLYIRISEWFSGKGLIDEAIQYTIKAENFELACDLISEHRTGFLEQGQWWVVQRWLNNIPRQIRKANVDLLLTELLICEETWNLEDFSSILDTLKSSDIENSSDENISRYLFHMGYFLTFFKTDPIKAVESLERSKALCHDESALFGGRRELILACSRQMLGLSALALKSLDDIHEKVEPSSKMYVRSIHGKVLVHLLSGNFESAKNDSKKLLFLVQDSDFLYTKGWGSYFCGNVAFQSYNEYEVKHALKEALVFEGVFNYRVYFDALAGLILFKTLEGDENASKKHLKELKEKVGKLKDNRFQLNYQSVKARVALLNGQGKQELAWAETNWVKQTVASYMFLIDVPELTKIRIIVSNGSLLQVKESLCVLSEVKAFLNKVHNRYHDIDIELIKAMALLRLEKPERTQASLEKALLLAEEKDVKRPVLEAYQVMPTLFHQTEISSKSQRILVRFGLKIAPVKTPVQSALNKEQLTVREQEIVAHISNGLRNKEIADQLSISTVTVKSHLTNIYRKLEVANRTSMLNKVRNLHILF